MKLGREVLAPRGALRKQHTRRRRWEQEITFVLFFPGTFLCHYICHQDQQCPPMPTRSFDSMDYRRSCTKRHRLHRSTSPRRLRPGHGFGRPATIFALRISTLLGCSRNHGLSDSVMESCLSCACFHHGFAICLKNLNHLNLRAFISSCQWLS